MIDIEPFLARHYLNEYKTGFLWKGTLNAKAGDVSYSTQMTFSHTPARPVEMYKKNWLRVDCFGSFVNSNPEINFYDAEITKQYLLLDTKSFLVKILIDLTIGEMTRYHWLQVPNVLEIDVMTKVAELEKVDQNDTITATGSYFWMLSKSKNYFRLCHIEHLNIAGNAESERYTDCDFFNLEKQLVNSSLKIESSEVGLESFGYYTTSLTGSRFPE